MAVRVSVRLRNLRDAAQQAWLVMHVNPRNDGQVRLIAEIPAAVASDPVSFVEPVTPAQAGVLKHEIMGGLLTARRQIPGGFVVELVSLGGAVGEERAVSQVASIAYAVAATLAVLHGTGVADDKTPNGGWGWQAEKIEAVPV
jgi:hypothetical protein